MSAVAPAPVAHELPAPPFSMARIELSISLIWYCFQATLCREFEQ